ncbi:hypothetical protein BMG_3693 [Priestia megaterium]|nr:hypothetical protein BMG_3693 [Priestia megaterium]
MMLSYQLCKSFRDYSQFYHNSLLLKEPTIFLIPFMMTKTKQEHTFGFSLEI